MSEQTIQNKLYSNNVQIMDKYECLSLGATTIKNLMDSKILKKVNISSKNLNKKPDVLILDNIGNVIIYQEQKIPEKFSSEKDIENAIKQEIEVAKEIKAKIYVVTDGTKFIWINPLTEQRIKDENGNDIIFPIKQKKIQKN